jgi:CheY-like chemotaxis protein
MRIPSHLRCGVLIVEDEVELRDVMRVALEAEGYDVTLASHGRDALTILRSTPTTCLILLDLELPVMNGRRFRAAQLMDRSLAWIPVVVVSGGMEANREARELGAQAFVRKPVDIDELRRTVGSIACARTRQLREQRMDRGATRGRWR